MRVTPINLKFHGAWLAVLLICGAYSFTQVSKAISLWNSRKAENLAHEEEMASIEKEAELTQTKIDNHINIFDSVVLTDYTCDPNDMPRFDTAPFIKDHNVKVADRYQRVIGYISPNGMFHWHPGNCDIPIN